MINPTRADLQGQLDGLSSEDRELLELILAEEDPELLALLRNEQDDSGSKVKPAQSVEERTYPLSFAQQRLWFLNQLEPDIPYYHVSNTYRLTGPLNVPALEQSLNEIVQRQDVLRTRLVMGKEGPYQVIDDVPRLSLPLVDLRYLSPGEREGTALALAREESTRPFNLAKDLTLRARLLRLEEEIYILVIVMHHVASDGWSLSIFWRELKTFYAALIAGKQASLPPLGIHYADYAVWQRDWLQGDVLEEQVDFWRCQLDGLQMLDLPTDHPRPAVNTYQGALEFFELPQDLTERVSLLARSEGVTLYMLLLAAFAVLLRRATGQDDIAVGAPIANRKRREAEELIGFFVNTLVLRTDLAGNPPFRELLQRVRRVTLQAYDHQDLPFEKLVEELHPQRNLSRNPLFQVLFTLQNMPREPYSLAGLSVERVRTGGNGTSLFDLSVFLTLQPDGMDGQVQYRSDLFEQATIQHMIANYQSLLAAIVADPDCRIDELPLLTETERQHILDELSVMASLSQPTPLIPQLFATQVRRTPDVVALIDHDRQFSYRELDQRANRIAWRLKDMGVTAGASAAVYMTRTAETIVCLLGILKAGSAYLPLDPLNPPARLGWMLRDSRAACLIVPNGETDPIEKVDIPVLFESDLEMEHISPGRTRRSAPTETDPPDFTADGDDLAYVMYTSGTTGQPKGVAMRHGAVANLIAWQRTHPILGRAARTLQFSALSFDVSFQEIFSTWCIGGTLILVDQETRQDPRLLAGALREQGIERVYLPNIALQQIAPIIAQDPQAYSLQTVITAGEQLQISDVIRRMAAGLDGFTLHNHYGPTETHVVSEYILEGDPGGWPALPPIGRPIPGARLYVLDKHQQLLPSGYLGELAIGGDVLARGYLYRPDLTQERFLPDSFVGETGARMYLTGDLVRWSSQGELEFLGRIDDQVKIRGYRVEPAEVEAVLRRHPGVREATVLAREDQPGQKRLAAYYVPAAQDATPSVSELRAYLGQQIPDYMIPTDYVVMESLPLSAHGKIDRTGLPVPDASNRPGSATHTPPRSSEEKALAAIWGDVLGLEQVGVHDDFFELGGHSLLGIQLFARIEEDFGKRLPLSLLFSAPTVAHLAEHLVQPGLAGHERTLITIQAGGDLAPFFCVHGFGGGVLGYADLARLLPLERPFYGLQAYGLDGEGAADTTIEEMASRYIRAMREVQPQGPYRVGGYCFGGVVAYEIARQLEANGEKALLLAIMEGYAPRQYQHATTPLSMQRWQTVWQNIPYWLEDYWSLGFKGLRLRMQHKAGAWRKRLLRRFGKQTQIEAQDVVLDDLSVVPVHHRRMMETHVRALRIYAPEPIQGRVTLFAARGKTISQALFSPGDPEHGWGSLAGGGVEIVHVEGGHRNIHMQPNVSSLASALEESLAAVEVRS